MDTNDEVRRRRLARLCRETEGGLIAVASNAGLSFASLDQIMKKVLLPEKKGDKTRSARSLGDKAARTIEAANGLAPGWLDWPLETVDYESYVLLTEMDRGVAQTRMMAAIEDRLKSPIYSEAVKVDRAGNPQGKAVPAPSSGGHNGQTEPEFGPALTKFLGSGNRKKNGRSTDDAAKLPKRSGNSG
jgi:hypothetical protein